MKTRKDQIEEMANIIKADYKQWLDITGVFPERSCYYFECLGGGDDCAELLYNAGFGDVKEYKAEIEDLKDEIFYLERKLAISDMDCNEKDKAIQTMEKKQDGIVKQAQIDVLNKVKERAVGLAAIETYHICNLIDELIKEVQNDSL